MEQPIIRIDHLGKEFQTAEGKVRALNDISLEISQGRFSGSSDSAAREKALWSAVSTIWKCPRKGM